MAGDKKLASTKTLSIDSEEMSAVTVAVQGLVALEAQRTARDMAKEVDAEDRKQDRKNALVKLAYGALTVILGGGGIGGWQMVTAEEPSPVEPVEVVQPAVITEPDQTDQLDAAEIDRILRILGKRSLDQDAENGDGLLYIVDKIDLVHPRFKGKLKKPKIIKAAEDRAEGIRDDRALDRLFERVPAPDEDKSTEQ